MSAFGMQWAWDLDWLHQIPSNWRVTRLKNIATLSEIRNHSGTEDRLLSLSSYHGIIPKKYDDETLTRSGDELAKYWLVAPGQLVVNPMWLLQGAIAVSPIHGLVSPDYRVYKLKEYIWPSFLHHLLRSLEYVGLYKMLIRGTTTYDRRVSKADFHEIPVVIPPIPTQRTIAALLDRKTAAIDELIRKKRRLVELLQEKRQALITQAVTKGLDPSVPMKDSGIERLGQIPAHWRAAKVCHIGAVGNGSTPNRDSEKYWADGRIPWLNSSKINDQEIYEAEQFITNTAMKECHLPLVRSGSVIVAITGEGQTRGRAALLRIDTTINQHLVYITPRSDEVNPEFLWRQFESYYPWLRAESSGSGGTRAALTCAFLRSVPLLIPPEDEQRTIAEHVRHETQVADRLLEATSRSVQLLREYRQSLITAAVTGQLDVSAD
jgi:type I restriction enzyme S subunit